MRLHWRWGFEVHCQASAASEPGKGALDHASSGQRLEAFDAGWAFDDPDRPGAAIGDGLLQLAAAVDAVRDDRVAGRSHLHAARHAAEQGDAEILLE